MMMAAHRQELNFERLQAVNIFVPDTLLQHRQNNHLMLGGVESHGRAINFHISALLSPNDVCWPPPTTGHYDHSTRMLSLGALHFVGILAAPNALRTAQHVNLANLVHRHLHPQHHLVLTSKSSASDRSAPHRDPFTVEVVRIVAFGQEFTNLARILLIFYTPSQFMSSQLLTRFNVEDNSIHFVDFIQRSLTVASIKQLAHMNSRTSTSLVGSELEGLLPTEDYEMPSSNGMFSMSSLDWLHPARMVRPFLYFTLNKNSSVDVSQFQEYLKSLFGFASGLFFLSSSMILPQLKFRYLQFLLCWKLLCEIPRKRVSLSLGNLVCSIVLDHFLGILFVSLMLIYTNPDFWFEKILAHADAFVTNVYKLLQALQSMPAGLKLNRPLNLAMSQFFLYHIYLWKSYMSIIEPIFLSLMRILFFSGFFGFTVTLSLTMDLFSLFTLHIYCFYGYASLLLRYQLDGIAALWRLFRGKKWNQLLSRVDSYSYDNEQLFIGTILFTILLFLLPTVIMYYVVFVVLRILTLAVKESFFIVIEYMSSMPLYTLVHWMFDSKLISSRVYLHLPVYDNAIDSRLLLWVEPRVDQPNGDARGNHVRHNNHHHPHHHNRRRHPEAETPMTGYIQTSSVSLSAIISTRYDGSLSILKLFRNSSASENLTWQKFIGCILTGNLTGQQTFSPSLSLLLSILTGYVFLHYL